MTARQNTLTQASHQAAWLLEQVLDEHLSPVDALKQWPVLSHLQPNEALDIAYQALWYYEADWLSRLDQQAPQYIGQDDPYYLDVQLKLLATLAQLLRTQQPVPRDLALMYRQRNQPGTPSYYEASHSWQGLLGPVLSQWDALLDNLVLGWQLVTGEDGAEQEPEKEKALQPKGRQTVGLYETTNPTPRKATGETESALQAWQNADYPLNTHRASAQSQYWEELCQPDKPAAPQPSSQTAVCSPGMQFDQGLLQQSTTGKRTQQEPYPASNPFANGKKTIPSTAPVLQQTWSQLKPMATPKSAQPWPTAYRPAFQPRTLPVSPVSLPGRQSQVKANSHSHSPSASFPSSFKR